VWATSAPAQVGQLTLTYFDDSAPEILSVVPRSVYTTGGEVVTVSVSNLAPQGTLRSEVSPSRNSLLPYIIHLIVEMIVVDRPCVMGV